MKWIFMMKWHEMIHKMTWYTVQCMKCAMCVKCEMRDMRDMRAMHVMCVMRAMKYMKCDMKWCEIQHEMTWNDAWNDVRYAYRTSFHASFHVISCCISHHFMSYFIHFIAHNTYIACISRMSRISHFTNSVHFMHCTTYHVILCIISCYFIMKIHFILIHVI